MPRRRQFLSIGVLAVCLAGAAGSAPAGVCPCPLPKPGSTFAGTVPVWGRDGVYVGVF